MSDDTNCRDCKDYEGEMTNQYDVLVPICHRFRHTNAPPLWMGCDDFTKNIINER